jgi:hypothetical protein
MGIVNTIIYTNNVKQVAEFYKKHFLFDYSATVPNGFAFSPIPRTMFTYLDAAEYGEPESGSMLVRIPHDFTEIEKERLETGGVVVSDIIHDDWGEHYGAGVRYIEITDPAEIRLQLYEDHIGETRSYTTTADGTPVNILLKQQDEERKKQEEPVAATD